MATPKPESVVKPKITYLEYRAILNSKLWADVLAVEMKIKKASEALIEKTKEEWDEALKLLKNRPAGNAGPANYVPVSSRFKLMSRTFRR